MNSAELKEQFLAIHWDMTVMTPIREITPEQLHRAMNFVIEANQAEAELELFPFSLEPNDHLRPPTTIITNAVNRAKSHKSGKIFKEFKWNEKLLATTPHPDIFVEALNVVKRRRGIVTTIDLSLTNPHFKKAASTKKGFNWLYNHYLRSVHGVVQHGRNHEPTAKSLKKFAELARVVNIELGLPGVREVAIAAAKRTPIKAKFGEFDLSPCRYYIKRASKGTSSSKRMTKGCLVQFTKNGRHFNTVTDTNYCEHSAGDTAMYMSSKHPKKDSAYCIRDDTKKRVLLYNNTIIIANRGDFEKVS